MCLQAHKGKERWVSKVNFAGSYMVPFDGHQLSRFIALAHQHTPIGAITQLSHGCVPVHLGKIMQQKLLIAMASLLKINLNASLFLFVLLLDCCCYTGNRFVIIKYRLFPNIM